MAIVRMKKLSVIGLDHVKKDLMKELMRLGVVQLTDQNGKLSDEEWASFVSKDGDEETAAKYDAKVSEAAFALETLSKADIGDGSLFPTRRSVTRAEFEQVLEHRKDIEKRVEKILEFNRRLIELKTEANKLESLRLSLLPWERFDLDFSEAQTRLTVVIPGVTPGSVDPVSILQALDREVPESHMEMVEKDAEQNYLSVICLKEHREKVLDVLRQFGFSQAPFEGKGNALEHLEACELRMKEVAEELQKVNGSIKAEALQKKEIEYLHDQLVMERDQQRIRSRLLVTERTFYLAGWVPRLAADKVAAVLEKEDCWYELEEPEKGEETPVLLENRSFSTPFEAITKLYALPNSRSVDATPFFSFFYAVFFGMMLSDAAYGLILAVACFVMLKKFRLEGLTFRMVKMLFYCGISTVFWGVMFGGYFGDAVSVIANTFFHKQLVIPPVWINPVENVTTLLVFSLILGIIHLFVGMGLSGYLSIKDGRPFDAICDVGFWYLIIAGLALWTPSFLGSGGESMARVGLVLAGIGAAGVILFGGRHKKGFGRVFGGVSSLYGVTSYLSDILSYSRLLALGLATGVIAQVVNTMGSLLGGGIVGGILFVVVFIVGHVYNMAINSLGSFVHSSRLQYVEFFGKFYESGGEEFEPFDQNTKYVEIAREEN